MKGGREVAFLFASDAIHSSGLLELTKTETP